MATLSGDADTNMGTPLVQRIGVAQISLGGRLYLLMRPPFCWCDKPMEGYRLPFSTAAGDVNWLCADHGNDGLALEYVTNERTLLATCVAGWEEAPWR